MIKKQKVTKTVTKKEKKVFLSKSLLLKQTLVATWKSKLQLVILLLLSAFATSLITGIWVSYTRLVDEKNELGLQNVNFDAVLPYSPVSQGVKQIANQAFSLKLGHFYTLEKNPNNSAANIAKGLYFDDSRIGYGQEIEPLSSDNLLIDYKRDNNKITSITNFSWKNSAKPLSFNLDNKNVKASMYGQLWQKALQTTNINLKNHFIQAANDLYQDVFLRKTAPTILTSLSTFFADWIKDNPNDDKLTWENEKFNEWFLTNKVNFRITNEDKTIPDYVDLSDDIQRSDLFTKLVKSDEPDPKLKAENGMNGQWMRIYRKFEASESASNIYSNFIKSYSSPSNYNEIKDATDSNEQQVYSFYLARAAAALQCRDLYVRNQFTALATQGISIKVVNIGFQKAINHTNLKIFEGIAPQSSNEVVISPQYARKNNSNKTYKPGDNVIINGKTFIVSGIGGDAYDIYPTINELEPVPNTRAEFIAYVMPAAWHNNSWYDVKDKTDTSLMYFTPWANTSLPVFNNTFFNDYFQKTIFNDNGSSDLQQSDYNNYLIAKYVDGTIDPPTKYKFVGNPFITSDSNQFWVYTNKKTIFERTLTGFKYAACAGVIFLLTILIFITTLIVKKAIQHGQISMGILKSIGYKTWQITCSYLAYPLITLIIALPIGWIIGLVLQVYLTELFNTLFVLPYNMFVFDIISLFIAIVLIIGFITLVTLLTAFQLLKKDALFLIKKDSDLVLGQRTRKRTGNFLENYFWLRFLLSLSKTSWKKILVTASVISLATLSIVVTTAIPATINSLKTSYFKSQKYKNYYEYQTPMPNMPLSKYGLYSWNYFNKPTTEPYYPVYGAMPWPEDKIVYDKNTGDRVGWYNPLDFQKKDNTNNFRKIFKFDKNFPNTDKSAFLTKMTDFYQAAKTGTLSLDDLVWSYTWMGGKAFSNQVLKDLSVQDKTQAKIFSNSVIAFTSDQLPRLLSVVNPGVDPGPEAIAEILKQVLPGFVRQSIDSLPHSSDKNENPYDYFSIGHNTIAFNPKFNAEINGPDEELITQFELGVNNSEIAKEGFMDIVGINPKTKMIVLSDNEVKALKYEENAKTIPLVINRAFQAKFGLKVGSQFDAYPNVNTLDYKNNKGENVPFPKNNWYYGEKPPATIVNNDNGNIWSKNGTKWNYRGAKTVNSNDIKKYSDEQGTAYNGMYDENGQPVIKDEPETWNNVNKIWLKLPDDMNINAFEGDAPRADNVGSDHFTLQNIAFEKNSKWIKPFSFDFVNLGLDISPTNILLKRPSEWFMTMVNNGILTKKNTLTTESLAADIKNNIPLWEENVLGEKNPVNTYRIIGIQDSYDSSKAYIDQAWANKIIGYDAYNDNNFYDNRGAGIYQWFNGKLSANDNIFDIIGRMSYKSNLDDYTIYATTNLKGNENVPLIAHNDLLSRKKVMLTKMSDIAFSANALFIVITIICSILIVIMITDLFTDQFRRFMAHMKAEGYTNWEINSFTIGIFTPWVFVGYLIGFGFGFLAVYILINIITVSTALVLPFTIAWWILPASFVVILSIYTSTFMLNNRALNKMNLIELLKLDE